MFVIAIYKFTEARFKMEKLLQDLESQVSCSICLEILRTPKIMPCFHAFCLQCLNRMAAHRASDGEFECPTCRATTLVPQPEGTFDSCASSFLHNRLLDLLAIKEARNTPTLCGNCVKTASDCSYCFECGNMFCSVCLQSHNALRSHAEHKVKALEYFEQKDYEDYLQRPTLCNEKFHRNQPLVYYCQTCQLCLCQQCCIISLKTHSMHEIVHLEEAAEKRKNSLLADIRKLEQLETKYTEAKSKNEQKHIEINKNVDSAKKEVSEFADKLVRAIRNKERDMLEKFESLRSKGYEEATQRQSNLTSETEQLRSAVNYARTLIDSRTTAELMTKRDIDDHLKVLLNLGRDVDRQTSINTVAQFYPEERVQFNGTEIDPLGHVVTNIQKPTHSPAVTEGSAQCQSHGQSGVTEVKRTELTRLTTCDLSGAEAIDDVGPIGVAVRREGEIVVADYNNGCILITDITGQCKRTLGHRGDKPGEFNGPQGVAFTGAGDIVVADCYNHRIQVLNKDSGDVIKCFGSKGSAAGQFSEPDGVFVDGSDRIIVTDNDNDRVQVFSSTGEFVFKFGGQGEQKLNDPTHCISVNNVFIVSDTSNHCIKIFDTNGKFLYKFGEGGSEDGYFNLPWGLAVDGKVNLLVCDSWNERVQLMTVDGQFIAKTTCQLSYPRYAAVMDDGKIVVSESYNQRLSVIQLNGNE